MYLSYYNLKVKPFQMSTNPEFLWLGEKHKEALAVLKYAILENKGVLALTGDVGTGKTTLINALLKSLGEDTITATVYDARLDILDFFQTVAAAFKIKGTFEGKGKFILKFMDFLIKVHERNKKVLLIIDEAQGINKDLLEEIRLLSNLEAEYTRLLNIFFVGQNEFIDILQKYENRALRQRVTIRYHIDPLTLNETAAYIRHRLEVSGTTAPIFNSGAIDEIYFFSGGYPRLINIICDHALLTGYVREVRTINANLIRECREELLVSKKSSGETFEIPAGNQQMPYREPMVSGPSTEPSVSGPPAEPSVSGPPAEPMASDLSRELMDYVKDSQLTRDEQYSFGPKYSTYKPASRRQTKKKRFFGFRSILIFLLVAGAGYFLYGKYYNRTASFVTTPRGAFKKYFSMNEKPKNDNPATTKALPDASDMPKQVQSEKPEDFRSPAIDFSKSGMPKAPVPKKTESFQPGSSKEFSQNAEAASFSKIPVEPEAVGKTPAVKPDKSDSLNVMSKEPLDAKSINTPASIKTNDSGNSGTHINPITTVAPLTPEKPLEKIRTPDKTPAKIVSKPSAVAAAPSNSPAKAPVIIPAPTIRKESIGKKAKEPKTVIREAPKKESTVASSVSSEKQTKALFEKFKDNLTKKTVGSEDVSSVKAPATIKEKTPSAFSESDQKNPINHKASGRGDKGTEEKIASLGVGASKSEKAGKTHLTYIPLMTRLESFLKKYCRTYEQKDIDRFSTLFAFNALEKGKPFKSWFPTYRRNFKRINSIEYNIDLKRYATQEESGLVKVDGTFHIRAKLDGSKEWLKNSGDISMILEADGNSFKVKQLDY
jgi:type II secretory pathway predicted ATPase ExeA